MFHPRPIETSMEASGHLSLRYSGAICVLCLDSLLLVSILFEHILSISTLSFYVPLACIAWLDLGLLLT